MSDDSFEADEFFQGGGSSPAPSARSNTAKRSDTRAERDSHSSEYADNSDNFDNQSYDDSDVTEIHGTASNIERAGSPIDNRERAPIRYYFYPTWRSQLFPLMGFGVLCILAVVGSRYLTWTIIAGELLSFGSTTYYLHLPLLALLPGFFLGKILIYIYDSKYIIDERGVEAQVGLVSLNLRQPRLRYEDIRGVEPNQTILERILGIGSVLIGSAMTQDVEIVMEGVANPRAIQLLLQGERDKRLSLLGSGGRGGEGARQALGITGD
ncbi:MAG: PH domain-containing protein [Bdellovibrionales bacterium]|nr:PH domain-containing protein [Bdellovibrionales bacterium]